MVAADSRFDYLSCADGTWSNELHGVLTPEVLKKKSLAQIEREIFCYSRHVATGYFKLKSLTQSRRGATASEWWGA